MERAIELRRARELWRSRELSRDLERVPYTGTLKDLGRFGVARLRDIDPDVLEQLVKLRAVDIKHVVTGRFRPSPVVVPTSLGRSAAKELWAGEVVVRSRVPMNRLEHDSAVYGMYRMESNALRLHGGVVTGMRLEHEFKRDIFALRGSLEEIARYARHNHLHVVDGRLRIPDLRIEYRDRDGNPDRRDLEVASSTRGCKGVSSKRGAGMKVYTRQSGKHAQDRHDDMAKLLS